MQHVKGAALITGSLSTDMRDTVCSNSCKARQRSPATMRTRRGEYDVAAAARRIARHFSAALKTVRSNCA
ncbi:hypothetical protein [Xanthomonas sacchari]|uniref:hypothetical protein n=1 Tax=Xanthomonas sacchari TaxID=56458 RepID=UPI0012DFEA6B|nr:hypothetical protein [Xanthomonas sacchari]MDV0439809.1 hypothetical protein [Xanthomonas sacchari]